jgi:hypothetical protein
MGIRSDVGVALKHNVLRALENNPVVTKLLSESSQVLEEDEGKLFVFEHVKWYRGLGGYEDIDALYSALSGEDDGDYRIVEACHDYPNSKDGDCGGWDDNPWDLCRSISVTLWYEGAE